MLSNLRIGFLSKYLPIQQAACAKTPALQAVDFCEYATSDELHAALSKHAIDAVFLPLSELPTEREDTTIAAAVLRVEPRYGVFIKKTNADNTKLLKLPENPIIEVCTILEAAQIRDCRTDIQIVYKKTLDSHTLTQLSARISRLFDISNYVNISLPLTAFDSDTIHNSNDNRKESEADTTELIVELDATEFIPLPAQGVFVLLCAKNKHEILLTKLKSFNDKKLVTVSNVERRVLQLIGYEKAKNNLGVYCECDANGNYHAWACWCESGAVAPRYVKVSHSTFVGLAESIVKKLDIN